MEQFRKEVEKIISTRVDPYFERPYPERTLNGRDERIAAQTEKAARNVTLAAVWRNITRT